MGKVHDFLDELNKLERGAMTLGTFWKSKDSVQKKLQQMKDKESEKLARVVNNKLHF